MEGLAFAGMWAGLMLFGNGIAWLAAAIPGLQTGPSTSARVIVRSVALIAIGAVLIAWNL